MSFSTITVPLAGVPGPGLPLLVSSVIPPSFAHGFTTRAGGVSADPFASLNLGGSWGDARDDVAENRRRLLAASGARTMYFAAQVHGADAIAVNAHADATVIAGCRADALYAQDPGIAVGIFVADCVPLVISDARTGGFAAVHAGWRGAVAGVATTALASLGRDFGAAPGDVRVAMGPAIGACCFEVGPEVVAAFEAAVPEARVRGVVIETPGRRPHIDLRLALRMMLENAGVPPASIDATDACTKCDPENRFYSYRRDARRTGQLVGFIGRAPVATRLTNP